MMLEKRAFLRICVCLGVRMVCECALCKWRARKSTTDGNETRSRLGSCVALTVLFQSAHARSPARRGQEAPFAAAAAAVAAAAETPSRKIATPGIAGRASAPGQEFWHVSRASPLLYYLAPHPPRFAEELKNSGRRKVPASRAKSTSPGPQQRRTRERSLRLSTGVWMRLDKCMHVCTCMCVCLSRSTSWIKNTYDLLPRNGAGGPRANGQARASAFRASSRGFSSFSFSFSSFSSASSSFSSSSASSFPSSRVHR